MSTASDLTALGWRTDTATRLRQAIWDFQNGNNIGPRLFVDGKDGPKTRAAIKVALDRKAKGLPTASANFSFTEFRCACGGYSDCKRIWVDRDLIIALEAYRNKLVGPLFIVRGCRCPRENKRVNGASRSQHLYGRAADLPIFDVSPTKIKTLGVFTGMGLYDYRDAKGARQVMRHGDVRPENTPSNPAKWDYGDAKTAPLKPQPPKAGGTTSTPPVVFVPSTPATPVKVGEVVPGTKRLAVDGDFGKATITELQKWMKRAYGSGVTVDGQWGPSSARYLEHVLNGRAQLLRDVVRVVDFCLARLDDVGRPRAFVALGYVPFAVQFDDLGGFQHEPERRRVVVRVLLA